MFKCDNCGGLQAKGVKAEKAVVERREREYRDSEDKVLGTGWEIVKELTLCKDCRGLFV